MTESPDRLDRSLDTALAEYGRSEPRPGLEGRVLASLQARRPAASWLSLVSSRPAWTAAGVLAIAVSFTAIFLIGMPRTRGPESPPLPSVPGPASPPAAVEPPSFPPGPAVAETSVPRAQTHEASRLASAPRVTRRPAFPERRPLSEQELLLLRYVAEAPPDEVEARAGFLDAPAPLPALSDPTTQP